MPRVRESGIWRNLPNDLSIGWLMIADARAPLGANAKPATTPPKSRLRIV